MTKSGKKKDRLNSSSIGANINPFEVHINHSKHKILGQKIKDDRGLPGISRTKALRKRERTLQTEFKNRHKSSKFVDKRIGENDAFMDPEKKIMMRMIAEKKKQLSKKNLYTLNEDEELFHGGKSLNESTMKDKSTFSDEDDDDDLLDAKFVKDQHFGGDLFLKPKEKSDESSNSGPKSRKEWIEEMITESKKKKAETKMEKEIHNSAVTKLDEKFHSFLQAMKGRQMTDEEKISSKKTCEFNDYDKLVGEMLFDRSKRAQPSNRLKTEEELVKEEHERLQKLEEERKRRMNGEDKSLITQKSADALDDGFTYFEKQPLSLEDIKSMKCIQNEKVSSQDKDKKHHKSKKFDEIEEEVENVEEEEEEDESEETEEEEEENEEEEDETEDTEDEEQEDELEDSDEDANEEADITDIDITNKNKNKKNIKKKRNTKKTEIKSISTAKSNGENIEELPYTFAVPKEYDDFWSLLENHSPSQVSTVIERMIKCNHPSLGADNKAKMNNIFAFVLQTLQNVCSTEPENLREDYNPFSYISSMVPHLYTLTHLSPNDCSAALNEVLDEKYEEYSSQKIKKYPYFDTFVFLKVSGLLFPASDLHHVVMTRVLTFLAQILYESKVLCGRDIVSLLFTSGTLIEYLSQSRRFLGEITNSLNGILYLAISKKGVKGNLPINPPFKSFGPFSELLVLSDICQSSNEDLPQLRLSLINEDICINDKWKLRFISEALIQLKKLCLLWVNKPSVRSIFLPTMELIEHLPVQSYPVQICNLIESLKTLINKLPKQVPHLRKVETIGKTLKMIDPLAEDLSFDIKKKKKKGDKQSQEEEKLKYKIKRERKGVKRELKRDAQFLARLQLKEVLEKDNERKRKVNLIMQGLATQEHEFKKFKSKK